MPKLNDIQSMTRIRRNFADYLDKPKITPVSHYGKLTGVLISIGDVDENEAKRLHRLLKANPTAAINALRVAATAGQDIP